MTKLQDPPNQTAAVEVFPAIVRDHYEGKFSAAWKSWLITLKSSIQTVINNLATLTTRVDILYGGLQNPPTFTKDTVPHAGPGPHDTTITFTLTKDATLFILGTIAQTWTTASPGWQFLYIVDGATVVNTGMNTDDFQPVVTIAWMMNVLAGPHTVTMRWLADSANGTLQGSSLQSWPFNFGGS